MAYRIRWRDPARARKFWHGLQFDPLGVSLRSWPIANHSRISAYFWLNANRQMLEVFDDAAADAAFSPEPIVTNADPGAVLNEAAPEPVPSCGDLNGGPESSNLDKRTRGGGEGSDPGAETSSNRLSGDGHLVKKDRRGNQKKRPA